MIGGGGKTVEAKASTSSFSVVIIHAFICLLKASVGLSALALDDLLIDAYKALKTAFKPLQKQYKNFKKIAFYA